MRKYGGLIALFFLISCSALPTKEVELARGELSKARENQAEKLSEKDFKLAEEAFLAAERFLKEKEGDKAKSESVKSLEKSRVAILDAKEARTREKIKTAQALMEEARKTSMAQDKIAAAQAKLDEAVKRFEEGRGFAEGVRKNLSKLEPLPELDSFIKAMDESYSLAEEAEKLLSAELESLRRAAALYSAVTNGRALAQSLVKDPFITQFYSPEREGVIKDFEEFVKSVEEGRIEDAEKQKEAYDRLVAFSKEMSEMKLALGAAYQKISQKMIDKINAYYRQDAESHLEKARRLKEEVYRLYGRPEFQQQAPERIEGYSGFKLMNPVRIEQQAGAEAEDALFRQLDGLYQDAESYFEKEEYTDSIEKAKETIELAEKMLKLKKAMVQKDMGQAGFQDQTGVAEVTFKSYRVKKGDCLWKIAMRPSVYRKAYLWPLIWFANKEMVKDPDLIEPGTALKIPVFK